MKILFLISLLLCTCAWGNPFPAPGYSDRTDGVLAHHKRKGIELLRERTIEGVRVRLHLAQSAKEAIAKGQFLIPDRNFDLEKLGSYVLEAFQGSLGYFKELSGREEVKELELVIVDKGGDQGTISEVPIHSRVIELHLVRWHKYLLRRLDSFVQVSSIHEFAHVVNYMYSPRETKLHREFVGVLMEGLNLIRLYGINSFKKTYQRNFASTVKNTEQLKSDTYTNMPVLRHIAYTFFINLFDGTYRSTSESQQAAESFVISYLQEPLDDREGLNTSLLKSGILDQDGSPLTFEQLRGDTFKRLVPSP